MEDFKEIALTIEQRQELEAAFLNAFNHDDLAQMLRLKMGIKIGEELNFTKGLKFVVTELIDIAISGGWFVKLLLSAREYRPGNTYLKNIATKLNIVKPEPIIKENIDVIKDVQGDKLLEKIVRKRAPFIPFDKYIKELSAIGAQIARIEIPAGIEAGTGWLVGPNLLLTAYHVIEAIHNNTNGLNQHDLSFRFDYTIANGTGRICEAAATNWLIDHSPYSQHDLQPSTQDPLPGELDYALIELAENIGEEILASGLKRGWIEIPEHPVAMSPDDFVMIPQHPDGRPLELAFGELLKYNKAANRVQYDTSTEPGSSGSPCFDISLQPFALHHASGPAKNLDYNQGVPLREIIKLMKQKNINPFWKKK